ncbi:autophagy protein ATG9 [Aspergillus luchuensis]|uniref:Autophagy-related protein 9 n=1 Tax=Aspergillus kawachii TaxID=1069201 RepID=A0A146F9H8_ASPKA|nr:autophagy protein atg9 [Aspergillus luchuensis]BCS01564.1 autophagy protein atg9 [Aspergillus luchuensis]BCS13279.1 autophagy protein atg9 [Aspergillus luchuensis]GAA87989.1 autophagy protein Apg9 [Aspergillus luchuensis IFO 4308]GAT22770.1 autophagy protein Apg9 [Aspergillus luchuensis]
MMTSNILSRFLPPNGSPSVYETIRQHDNHSDGSDVEERAGMAFDDEHGDRFSDRELEDALADAGRDDSPGPSDPFLPRSPPRKRDEGGFLKAGSRRRKFSRPGRIHAASPRHKFDDSDDDVPPSLLVEGDQDDDDVLKSKLPPPPRSNNPPNLDHQPRSSPRDDRVHWETARERLPLHDNNRRAHHASLWSAGYPNLALVDPKEKALWMWANVENLDNFLKEVYTYFLGNGIWSILLNRVLSLLTFAFVVGFSIFLTNCIDYHKVRGSRTLDDILIQKCTKQMSMSATFLLWLLSFFWIGKAFQYLLDIRRLKHMHDFYHYLLGISDAEIQSISWQEVVSRLMTLRDSNPATAGAVSAKNRKFMGSQSKQRMDAHDIANRLMRKENYLIALINKDILDLTLPIPFLRNRQLFSRTLEWNINLCIMDYVFNEQGQVRTLFLKDTHRRALSEGLRRRFMFAGIMNIFVAPFIVVYFMMHYFFRYFNEYKKNPSQIGSRQYTPLAEWKFREFNELWHLFERRVNMSYPFASRYVDQFPKDKMVQFAGFVAFVSGALASVLALASVVDPELFLGFEITHDRTVLFYLGVFGSIWAVAQGLVPEETNVFDPEYALLEVINFTHYFPSHWKGRLHSDDVRKDFAVLYQMKIVIFLEEILSMIFTPFILWFSLPKCSDRLIDFFREFTVHVDGMGYLCSFAVFDFKKGTNVISQGDTGRRDAARQDLRADYFSTKDGKMLASYYGFLDNYGANPRGAHPSTKRQFHPPPTFPTLGSPSAIEMGNFGDRPAAAGLMGQQSTYGAPRFGPAGMGDHLSPAPSMLLDPHHQPSASGFRSTHRANPYPRYRASRPPPTISDPIEDEDPPAAGKGRGAVKSSPGVGSSGGGILTSDSNLGESWRMNLVGDEVEEEDEGGENVDALAGGAGVLGLIQQFQKVNQDNRGRTTVGI